MPHLGTADGEQAVLNESTELRFSAATSTGRTWRPSAPTRPEFTSSVLTGSASGCPLTSRSADYRAGPTTWPDFRATPARWLLRPPDIEAPAGQRPFPLQCYYRRGHAKHCKLSYRARKRVLPRPVLALQGRYGAVAGRRPD